MFNKKTKDMLIQKQEKLKRLSDQYSVLTATVTDVVQGLADISKDINDNLSEIDTYKKELDNTADGLRVALDRNEKVMSNFKALLAID